MSLEENNLIETRPLKRYKVLEEEWKVIEKTMFNTPANMLGNKWNEEREDERQVSNEEHVKSIRLMDHNLLPIPVKLQFMFVEAGLIGFHDEIVFGTKYKSIRFGLLSTLYDSIIITLKKHNEKESMKTEIGHPFFGNKTTSAINWNYSIDSQEPLALKMPGWFYSDQYTSYPCLSSSERQNITKYWNYYSESAYMITPYIQRMIIEFKEKLDSAQPVASDALKGNSGSSAANPQKTQTTNKE